MARGKRIAAAATTVVVAALLSACGSGDDGPDLSSPIEVREVHRIVGTPGCDGSDVAAAAEDLPDSMTAACNDARDLLFELGPDAASDARIAGVGSSESGDEIEAEIGFDDATAERIDFLATRPGGTHHLAVVIDGVVMSHARVPDGLGSNRSVRIPGLSGREYGELERALTSALLTAPRPTESLTLSATVPPDAGDHVASSVQVRAVLADGLPEACGPVSTREGEDEEAERSEVLACDSAIGAGYRLGPDLIRSGRLESVSAREGDEGWLVDLRFDQAGSRELRRESRAIAGSDSGRVAIVLVPQQVLGVQELSGAVTGGTVVLGGGDRPFDVEDAATYVQMLTASFPTELPASDLVSVEWEEA